MIVLDLSILNQKGTPMFNSDLFANRPAAGIVGRIFISTDTKVFYRDTGTTWEELSGSTIGGSLATGQVAFGSATNTISGSNNLFWDAANNHLGINTNTPGTALDIHHNQSTILQLNQTTATNDTRIAFQNSGTALWRIGNFYTAGANDFGVFDVVGSLQQFTIVNTTGQTFIGAKTTASGRLVINSATADAHLQIVGANAPSIRIDNAGSGGTQRFVFGLATATNNFIQGATSGQFCISTQSSGAMLFGMWQTTNATEAMRISTANNLIVGSISDSGERVQINGTAKITGNTLISAGNLSIFTTTTARRLNFEVANGSKAAGISILAGGTIHTAIGPDTTGNDFLQVASRSGISFYSGSTIGNIVTDPTNERMRLNQSGRLLLGTTSDDGGSILQVLGDVAFSGVFRETITTNTQTASYSLVLSDNGKLILMNVSGANNLTIPLNSSINFPVGTKIDVSSIGAGQTTIVATGGVTINSAGGALKLRLQYSGATLVQTATDVWALFGDITT